VRIPSEHAISYLKGQFQSLKNLRVMIIDKKLHQYAAYWIVACIAVHNFALESEATEQEEALDSEDEFAPISPFITAGLSSSSSLSESSSDPERPSGLGTNEQVITGKERQEQLKETFLRHHGDRLRRHCKQRRQLHSQHVSYSANMS
jgi:hypothetical protein